jgi:hypothetical protein
MLEFALVLALALLAGCSGTPVAGTPTPTPSPAPTPAPAPAPTSPTPAPAPVADTACATPRTRMCSMIYAPVCATRDTGVRCITTPCPSSERKTYSSACTACVDPNVSGWTKGACPGG